MVIPKTEGSMVAGQGKEGALIVVLKFRHGWSTALKSSSLDDDDNAVMARNAIQPSFDFLTGQERSPPRQGLRESFRQSTATVARPGECVAKAPTRSHPTNQNKQILPMNPYAPS
jgi:hypothetical protein